MPRPASLTATVVDGKEILVTIDQQTQEPLHWSGELMPFFDSKVTRWVPMQKMRWLQCLIDDIVGRTTKDGYWVAHDWIAVDDDLQARIEKFYREHPPE